jgi:hypothetical protein
MLRVVPHGGADHAALDADHAQAELPHQKVARILVDVEDHLVAAAEARLIS